MPRYKIDPLEVILRLTFLASVLFFCIYGGYKSFHFILDRQGSDPAGIVAEVGKLIDLPQGETPTIATVANLEALKGQEFFKDAIVGDKVLIFPKSKRAILYRPSEHQIIAAAPLTN